MSSLAQGDQNMVTRLAARLAVGLALFAGLDRAVGEEKHGGAVPTASQPVEAGPGTGSREGGAQEHGSSEIQPLDFKTDLAIWTGVVFLVLLAILWRFAWGPLAQGLDRREQAIASQIAQAEEANRQAKELLARYEGQLADAKQEVRGMLEQAGRDAEARGREMLDKAKQEADAEHQRALREIDNATAGALKELAQRSATLAVELAGKIVQATLSPHDHHQLIEQAVANFAKQSPSTN